MPLDSKASDKPSDAKPSAPKTADAPAPDKASAAPLYPAAGVDPDAVIRAAKHSLAAADPTLDDKAEKDIERAQKARELISRRNSATDPAEVDKLDGELKGLGFDLGLTVPPQAQRGAGPVGRREPGNSKA